MAIDFKIMKRSDRIDFKPFDKPRGATGEFQTGPRIGIWEDIKRTTTLDVLEKMPISPYRGAKEYAYLEAKKRLDETKEDYSLPPRYTMTPMGGYTLMSPRIRREDDEQFVSEFERLRKEEETRGLTIPTAVKRGITDMIPWMVDIFIAKKITPPTIVRALPRILTTATILTATQPTRVSEAFNQARIDDPEEKLETSLAKAYGKTFIEGFSELTGEYIVKGGMKLLGPVWRRMPFGGKFLSKLNNVAQKLKLVKSTKDFVNKISTQVGYDGLIGEIGEERLATILHGIVGTEDFGAGKDAGPIERMKAGIAQDLDPRNILIETLILSTPLATKYTIGKTVDVVRKPVIGPKEGPDVSVEGLKAERPTIISKVEKGRLVVSRVKPIDIPTAESLAAEPRETIVTQEQRERMFTLLKEETPPQVEKQLSKGYLTKEEYDALVPGIRKRLAEIGDPRIVMTPPEERKKAEDWQLTPTNQQAAELGFTKADQAVIAFIEHHGAEVNLSGVPLENWYTYRTPEGLLIQSNAEIIGKGGYAELRNKAEEWLKSREGIIRSDKTGASMYDQWMKNPDYARNKKGVNLRVEWMTPDDYLQRSSDLQGVKLERTMQMIDKGSQEYLKQQIESGKQLDMPYLDYKRKNQEGRNRAFLAKEMGQQRIPVLIIEDVTKKPAAVAPETIIPQSTAIVKSSFSDWATDYSVTRARDLGVPFLINDPKIAQWRLSTLKEIEKSQRRFTKTYQRKLARREYPNVFNPWISARHAFASLGEKTGVPLWDVYDRIMRKGGAANIKAFEEISNQIPIDELASLTLEDNIQISNWLFSPKTRMEVKDKIRPNALRVAMKLEGILQGPAAKQVQEMVARRWIKSDKAPPDIWNYPTDVIVNKWMMEFRDKDSVRKLIREMLRTGIPTQAKLVSKIARTAKKENWSESDKALAITILLNQNVQAEISSMKGYPRMVLNSAKKAKSEKRLSEHIANDFPWTSGLGVRRFYYMSDPAKTDIIDDYIDSMSLRALEKPQIPEGTMPGTISYEAYAREGKPEIKRGSVVNNVRTHFQRVSIANAVADDMETMYDRLMQKVEDPTTGKDVAKIPLSDSDSRTIKDIFNNLLMKRQIAGRPWAFAITVKRWFWRTRLSLAARPDATVWMSFRNALQNLGMGPAAFNIKQTSKSMTKYAAQRGIGKTMEKIDPEMYKRFQRDFPSYVSQRRAFYREFLLQDTANISREFGNRRVAQRAASLLERTGGMYGGVDEYVNRMPLWIAQYQTTKNAALNYKKGKISLKSFLAKTGLDTVRAEQKMLAQDLLDSGRVNDLAAESANWMVEDVNLKYKTQERAGVEQTMAQRTFMGIYTFPRGAVELVAYRGVIPMMKGVENKNWNQARHGLNNVLKGLAAGELAAMIIMTFVGKSAYDIWSKNRYELLGPGAGTIADLLGSISMISWNLGQGNITIKQAGNRLADAFSNNIDEFIPLMKSFENIIETYYDTASLNSWRLLRDVAIRELLGDSVDWKHVSRSDYEKVMHLLIGSFEESSEKKIPWRKSFGMEKKDLFKTK